SRKRFSALALNGDALRRSKWSDIGNAADLRRPLAGPPPMTQRICRAIARAHEAYTFFATNTTDSQPPIGREPVGTDSVRYRRPDRPRLGRLSPVLLRNQPNRRDALSSCHNRLLVVTSSRLNCGVENMRFADRRGDRPGRDRGTI